MNYINLNIIYGSHGDRGPAVASRVVATMVGSPGREGPCEGAFGAALSEAEGPQQI